MKRCGTCKYRGEKIADTDYFACDHIKHMGAYWNIECSYPDKSAILVDDNGAYAELYVKEDFGCNQWAPLDERLSPLITGDYIYKQKLRRGFTYFSAALFLYQRGINSGRLHEGPKDRNDFSIPVSPLEDRWILSVFVKPEEVIFANSLLTPLIPSVIQLDVYSVKDEDYGFGIWMINGEIVDFRDKWKILNND